MQNKDLMWSQKLSLHFFLKEEPPISHGWVSWRTTLVPAVCMSEDGEENMRLNVSNQYASRQSRSILLKCLPLNGMPSFDIVGARHVKGQQCLPQRWCNHCFLRTRFHSMILMVDKVPKGRSGKLWQNESMDDWVWWARRIVVDVERDAHHHETLQRSKEMVGEKQSGATFLKKS